MHRNNFDFLRLLFAFMVVFTHCYAITGLGEIDALSGITKNQLVFSFIGLSGFFTLSGYLIFQSLLRSKNIGDYYIKRVLRIYPGLFVLMIVTFIVGAIVTVFPIHKYLTNPSSYTYGLSQLSLFYSVQTTIEGVFNNKTVNASLWTIVYEFSFYIILSILFLIKNKPLLLKIILVATFILLFILYKHTLSKKVFWMIPHTALDGSFMVYYGMFFCAGSMLAAFSIKKIKFKPVIILTAILFVIIALRMNHFNLAKIFLLPPIFILFGLMATAGISGWSNKFGDLSYGVYIYGFLVQQTMLFYFDLNYWQLFICVVPLLLFIGYLSWHFVEKKALALKPS